MLPADKNFTNFNLASNYDIPPQLIPSNLNHTPDFDAIPVPPAANSGLWGYNTESVAANQDGGPDLDILEQFLNNFPASTNSI
jgi:hypothetical protein